MPTALLSAIISALLDVSEIVAKLTVKVSFFSAKTSAIIAILIVLLVSPGAKDKVPEAAVKSVPDMAVPEDVAYATVVVPPVAPLRITVKFAVPAFSATTTSAMLNEGGNSLSVLVTETLPVLP